MCCVNLREKKANLFASHIFEAPVLNYIQSMTKSLHYQIDMNKLLLNIVII